MERFLLDIIAVLVDIMIMSSDIESDFTWDAPETGAESSSCRLRASLAVGLHGRGLGACLRSDCPERVESLSHHCKFSML